MQFFFIFSVYFFTSKVQHVQNNGENIPTTILMILTHTQNHQIGRLIKAVTINLLRSNKESINRLSPAERAAAECFV